MSDEIQITVSGQLSNTSGTGSSPLNRTYSHGVAQIDQTTKRRAGYTQVLTDSWEVISLGDVTAGYLFLLNTDATFNVDIGPDDAGSGTTGVLFGTIRPGDPPALIPIPSGVTVCARASGGSGATASVDVEIWSQ